MLIHYLCGGSYCRHPKYCITAYRNFNFLDFRLAYIGFRIINTL